MSKYRSLNYTELSSINIDNFNIIGVFKLTGATGTLPSDLTFPCIFENYEGFQISRKYDKIYNRQKSGASWSSWKELDLNDKSFLSLSDTPNSYTGFQGKLLRVNPNGTGLEFDNLNNDAILFKSKMDEIYTKEFFNNKVLFNIPENLYYFTNKSKFNQLMALLKKINDDYKDYDDIEIPVQIHYDVEKDSFNLIKDYRNKEVVYYNQGEWVEKNITTLQESNNLPKGFVLKARIKEELSNDLLRSYLDFMEIKRIREMSPEERELEMRNAIEFLKMSASKMRFELELEGDPEAFAKAKDWFFQEKQKIEEKYNQ